MSTTNKDGNTPYGKLLHNEVTTQGARNILITMISILTYSKFVISILEYVLISRNELCPENGMRSIDTKYACKTATTAIGIDGSVRTETIRGYPNGCYVHDNGNVFLNFDPTGSRQESSSPICQSFG